MCCDFWQGQSWDYTQVSLALSHATCPLFLQSRTPSFPRIPCHPSTLVCPQDHLLGQSMPGPDTRKLNSRHPSAAPVYVLCGATELLAFSPHSHISSLCGLSRRSQRGLKEAPAHRCTALPTHIHSPRELGRLTHFMGVFPFQVGSWVLFCILPTVFL